MRGARAAGDRVSTLFDLFNPAPGEPVKQAPHFSGETYDPQHDHERLTKQLGRVWAALQGHGWHTLDELAAKTGDGPASISARLRDLRKPRFGEYEIERRHRGDAARGLYEYRLAERR